jgi:hypothetical protein
MLLRALTAAGATLAERKKMTRAPAKGFVDNKGHARHLSEERRNSKLPRAS